MARGLRRAEIDPRVLVAALTLLVIGLGFQWASDGVFLSPRNLYNLAVQTSVVAVMASGMVLVIVARHIDLSVGSVLGFTGMVVAALQVEVLPGGAVESWPLAVLAALALGALIGAWQGYWVAYRGVPAFVVTLAGLLIFRGGAYLVTDGRTVTPLAPAFARLGGGLDGAIGATASSWVGVLAIAALVMLTLRGRALRRRHGVPGRPLWADVVRVGIATLLIAAFVGTMNSYTLPRSQTPRGIPMPVLILIVAAGASAALARVTRFGRHVFAIGGNPDAARLAGIDVRRVVLGSFVWMGLLSAVAGIVTTARLAAGTNSMGTLAELSVIAAAVIGGTSLAGGVGSVAGAVLGALVMQSLDNGMVLLGVSSALRQVLIGLVLIAAVWTDTVFGRRGEAR